jgi:ABC-type uncharacterized transport system involved in gliding motility auxiliary subunit
MNKKLTPLIGLVIAAILLVGINLLSARLLQGSRVDLTAQKLYTVTEGTETILEDLDEPVRLTLYYSRKDGSNIPQISNYATRVRELLMEYRKIAGDKLVVEFVDPEPFSEQEDEAALAGLQGVPVGPDVALFFGLVGKNSVDTTEVIPFFNPEREEFLEYDVSRLIYNLANPKRPVVGLITALPVQGDNDPMAGFTGRPVAEPWVIYEQLGEMYEMRDLGRDLTEIPTDVDVLLLIHPKDLPAQTLYAIDQFVLGGGHTVAFIDPHAEVEVPRQDPSNPMAGLFASRESNLGPLMGAWGLRMADKVVAGDRENASMITMRDQRGVPQQMNYIAYLTLPPESLNLEDVVTSSLEVLSMVSVGILEKTEEKEGLTISPLIQTSADVMRVNVEDIRLQPKPQELLANFQPIGERQILAARITGRGQTAYPDGPPEKEEFFDPASINPANMQFPGQLPGGPLGADEEPGSEAAEIDETSATSEATEPKVIPESHLAMATKDMNIIVVADVDMLSDAFWVQTVNFLGRRLATPRTSNGAFLLNAVENLSGSSELISIRSRGTMNRPFTKLEAIAKVAQEQFQAQERKLEERLNELQEELNQLQQQTGDQSFDSVGQLAEVRQKAREEMVKTRRELRDVRRELNREVDRLGNRLRLLNIALIPALVTVLAIALGIIRVNRRKSAA